MLQNLTKKVRGKPCPWLTSNIKTIVIDGGHFLRKMRKTKLENHITAFKTKGKEVNIFLRKAKSKYYQNLLDENIQSLAKFWRVSKRIYLAKNKQSLTRKSFQVN